MSTMIIHGRWYAIEGILAVAVAVFCLAILLPTERRYSDDPLLDSDYATEQTRRGARRVEMGSSLLNTAGQFTFEDTDNRELRRMRAESDSTTLYEGIRPYSEGRNRPD
ncbi:MAG: hypothetical protein GYB21_21340 [Oceanospirillales bacterium]|nr:hypothetical protein [Oceanospirillales bacterium]